MKHKTKDLTGALLDAAVALADGAQVTMADGEIIAGIAWPLQPGRICWADWRPSTSWTQGGPIIERERIDIYADSAELGSGWYAEPGAVEGPTPLIAAMRAYVAVKLGYEVDLP